MTEGLSLTGACLCGAVRFAATAESPTVGACHCKMCRRWSSGPFMEVTCQHVAFDDEEHIRRVRSSEWAERGFCAECGSNLFYRLIENTAYQLAVGLIDDQSQLTMSLQVFTDSKPPFYDFANETKMMTGAEVFAAYAPPSD